MAIFSTSGADYTVHTDIYHGPLDLLLNLIIKAELDITRLSLAKVTDQFLDHINKMGQASAVEVSGFLIIAAKLIQIKSEALLPRPPEREEGEEDPAESLIRQLKIYKSIKHTAQWLRSLEEKGHRTYIRLAPPAVVHDQLDLGDVSINELIAYLKQLYRYEEDAAPITSVVAIPRRTIKNKLRDLIQNLRQENKLSYKAMLPKNYDRIDAIVLFLAILELVKQQYALAEQKSLFSDIELSGTEKVFQNEEITLALEE